MPGGDRTGPLGHGSKTGRGAGFCAGYGVAGFQNVGAGFGYGRGRGFGGGGYGGGGRGWRHVFYATGLPRWARGAYGNQGWGGAVGYGEFTPEREMELLKTQSELFGKQIDVLNARIKELEELAAKKGDA
ncbi:MAG TPA: DUF5320 domain-containing protein [Spirochaetota bacterium]|nr:DUF5320 domain-containing protein [Spirochaetota bacterium]HOS39071.1 DUF5320 domain-containing protein [Spirochaetota bacterium]HPI22206.1 DUF5320 domain-containing protein [Spirochaetota bacterium]HPU88949.1 DUF5320 domain-containing protein [Spirochaetota bacterium]